LMTNITSRSIKPVISIKDALIKLLLRPLSMGDEQRLVNILD